MTVAVRRVDLDRSKDQGILHHLDPDHFFLLANTAGCYSASEAIRYARLARAAGFNEWVKLEVIGDKDTLLPDSAGLLQATLPLVAEGFKVLAYPNDDILTTLKLEAAGAAPWSSARRGQSCGNGPDQTATSSSRTRLLRTKSNQQ